jgi:RNA polymerase sigma-32 factor
MHVHTTHNDPQKRYVTKNTIAANPTRQEEVKNLNPLQQYMHEIRKCPLLTPKQELALAQTYVETKDSQVTLKMVTSNLRLVLKIAYEFSASKAPILDLVQEGNIGLIQAVKHFDPSRGVRLSSYARYWIRSYIIYYLLNNYRLIKIGTTTAQRKLFFNLRKEQARLSALGIEPTAKRLAEKFNVPEKTVGEMQGRMDMPEISMDVHHEDSHTTLADMLSDGTSPETTVSKTQLTRKINQEFKTFGATLVNERDQIIWGERLIAESPRTLQELGDRFGVSRERVRQLVERLKSKLKNYLTDQFGETRIKVELLAALD